MRSGGGVGRSARSGGGTDVPDDGRLTQVPTPSHPLLLNERLLVYPSGFECQKCTSIFLRFFLYYFLHTVLLITPPSHPSQATTQDSRITTRHIHVGNAGNDTRRRTRVHWLIHPGPTIIPTTRRRRALIRIFRSRCLISPAGAGAGVGGGRLRRSWSRERIGRGGGVVTPPADA
jgi:hypothetical protein